MLGLCLSASIILSIWKHCVFQQHLSEAVQDALSVFITHNRGQLSCMITHNEKLLSISAIVSHS